MPVDLRTSETPTLPIRCTGCRRIMGWSKSNAALRNAVFCSDWCAEEVVTAPLEFRNDMWRMLRTYGGRAPTKIASLYGITHSLVYKTLKRD